MSLRLGQLLAVTFGPWYMEIFYYHGLHHGRNSMACNVFYNHPFDILSIEGIIIGEFKEKKSPTIIKTLTGSF